MKKKKREKEMIGQQFSQWFRWGFCYKNVFHVILTMLLFIDCT